MNPEFSAVMSLITLLTDPAAAKAKLEELRSAIETADARKAAADTAHAQLETKLNVECDRLAKLEKSLRDREVAVFESERRHEDALDELRKWKRDRPSRLVQVGPAGGVTREPDLSENAPDPITDRYAEPLALAA